MCRHFSSHTPSSSTVSNQICIVATPDAVSSFLLPSIAEDRGYQRSYLVVASASTTTPPSPSKKFPADATSHNTGDTIMTPPTGPTTFKISPRLVYTDLYSLSVYHVVVSVTDFAALAAQHPLGLYQGSSTGVRRREWRKVREGAANYHNEESE